MQNLLRYLKKAKREKLQHYENELKASYEEKYNELKSKYDTKKGAVDKRLSKKEKEYLAQIAYEQTRDLAFEKAALQNEFLEKLWGDTVKKHFTPAKTKQWIEGRIKELPEQKGVLTAGKSYDVLSKMKLKGIYTLKKDMSVKEDGFVFESDKVYIDALLSTYLSEMLHENKQQLFSILKSK